MISELRYLFNPRGVAVVGATDKTGAYGRVIMESLFSSRFSEISYPVNVRADTILERKAYRSVRDIPGLVDLVIIIVPAQFVPSVIEDCAVKEVKVAVVISAGFAERGKEGAQLERQTVEIARKGGVRIIGPNCMGIYNPENGLDTIINPTERQGKPKLGSISLMTQSGALGAGLLDWMSYLGIGLSRYVSYGNASDVNEIDLIEFLADDPLTNVICLYIEGVKNGRKFFEVVKKASKKKPILVLKAGRTESGAQAAASHTGSLAGSDTIYDAVFHQTGIIRVRTIRELFVKAKALALDNIPLPKGDKIAVVTNGGGIGVITADELDLMGLKIANFSKETEEYLRNVLPPMVPILNPFDLIGDANVERYKIGIKKVLADPNVDGLIVIFLLQAPVLDTDRVLKMMEEASNSTKKPIIVCAPGSEYVQKYSKILDKIMPVYETPDEAVSAMKTLVDYARIK
jgi:acetyl coenzyme A synthetase (ADP forming)-like protein